MSPMPPSRLPPGTRVDQEVLDVTDGQLSTDDLPQWQMFLDAVAVAAAVLVLHDVARRGQVGDDAECTRSVIPSMEAISRRRTPGSSAMQTRTRAWLLRKLHSAM